MFWSEMSYNQPQLNQSQRLETEPEFGEDGLFTYIWIDEMQEATDTENYDYFSLGR